MTTKQQKYYLKNKEKIVAKLKVKRELIKQIQQNITEIPETNSDITELKQSKHMIPDEKKYIDALRSMLIPSHKFVSLEPCEKDERGKPIFFYINKYPDEDRTEISIVKIRCLKRGDGESLYKPNWEIVEEITSIYNSNLHSIMAFDANNRIY